MSQKSFTPPQSVINLHGELVSGSEAQVSVYDRSYLYGDSLYEVIRTYEGRFISSQMEAHMDRLWQSARLCRLKIHQSRSELIEQCQKALDHFKKQPFATQDAYCRLVLSRGVGKIGFGLGNLLTPTQFTVIVQPIESPTLEQFERGMSLQIVSRFRNHPNALDPAMKSGNYLNNLLAFLESSENGFDDALLCDAEGFVTEGTTFNVFYVRRGILCTPPLPVGILDGITRRTLLQLAQSMDLEVRETYFDRDRLYEADEVFATGTVKEIMPVTRIDHQKIGSGKPGVITRKLRSAFDGDIRRLLESEK